MNLISIGTVGLIKAIDSFDASKGTRLATYASRCIENEILMFLEIVKSKKVKLFFMTLLELIKKEMKLV